MAIAYQGEDAAGILRAALPRRANLLAEKEAWYKAGQISGPHLVSPEAVWNEAFALAQVNLQMLEAEQPGLGRYYYAGLEMFPFWFGGDGAYSLVGLLVGGRVKEGLNHLEIGLRYQEQGRVPHQISPSGHLAFSGSAQETPLWVTAVWDSYRWTGDRDFLARLYPGARRGLLEYTLGRIDLDGDGYPSGPGAVEREDMGEEKLDSAVYTWLALKSLVMMAEVLGDQGTAQQAREQAGSIESRFDADWWDPQGETYAMSLDEHNRRYPVPHWAIVVPLEVGLATPEHAAATLLTIQRDYLNAWGLKHTAGEDERVWTLPTVTLSRAAFRYGRADLGLKMLGKVAETLQHGPVGVFHELIPEGACFVQLWSAATFLRGVVEDLLGLTVNAGAHSLNIAPQLPEAWPEVRLENLGFGEHVVEITIQREKRIIVQHTRGEHPLHVIFEGEERILPPKSRVVWEDREF
jgi:glycogen debranching enzyme